MCDKQNVRFCHWLLFTSILLVILVIAVNNQKSSPEPNPDNTVNIRELTKADLVEIANSTKDSTKYIEIAIAAIGCIIAVIGCIIAFLAFRISLEVKRINERQLSTQKNQAATQVNQVFNQIHQAVLSKSETKIISDVINLCLGNIESTVDASNSSNQKSSSKHTPEILLIIFSLLNAYEAHYINNKDAFNENNFPRILEKMLTDEVVVKILLYNSYNYEFVEKCWKVVPGKIRNIICNPTNKHNTDKLDTNQTSYLRDIHWRAVPACIKEKICNLAGKNKSAKRVDESVLIKAKLCAKCCDTNTSRSTDYET